MGLMDRIKQVTGTDNNDNYNGYDDDYYNEFDNGEDADKNDPNAQNAGAAQNLGAQPSGMGGLGGGISLSGSGAALELKVVKPQHFDSVPQIADHLLNKRTVILNLENTNKETARRLIDFLSGVAYSIDGSLKKIGVNAYVITPSNVDVGEAQLRDKRPRNDAPARPQNGDADSDGAVNPDSDDLGGF